MRSRQPTIAPIWRDRTARAKADAYAAYHHANLKPLIEASLGVEELREDGEHESEFVTISY